MTKKYHKFDSLSRKKKAFFPFMEDVRRYRKAYGLGFLMLVFVDGINVLQPLVIKEAIDALAPGDLTRVYWAAGILVALWWVQAIGRYWWRIFLLGSSHQIAADIRRRFFSHLVRLSPRVYQSLRSGDLMSRATNDLESVRLALGPGVLVALDAAVLFLMIVPLMFGLSWKMALLSLAFFPFVPWITARFSRVMEGASEKVQEQLARLSANAQESFAGIRLIKTLGLEPTVSRKFQEISDDYTAAGVKLAGVQAGLDPTLSLITNLGTFLILLVGGTDVISGAISLGTFVAFQRFVVQLSWPMEAIGWSIAMTREGRSAESRLREVLNAEEVSDVLPGESEGWQKDRLLEIKSLRVLREKNPVLELAGLAISERERIGLVGEVGSGKSTLFDFILRLREPDAGSLAFHGRDIRMIPLSELRERVALVEQQITLFGESIRENLEMGLSRKPSEQEILSVIETVQLSAEIASLPKGIDTLLGERGVNLSGGQKQRLALARALLRRPELLLLDDCFSAVDVDNETQIITALFRHYPNLSVICASHRLAVMRQMGTVWYLEKGKVVEQGTHQALLETSSRYRALNAKTLRQEMREQWEKSPVAATETNV